MANDWTFWHWIAALWFAWRTLAVPLALLAYVLTVGATVPGSAMPRIREYGASRLMEAGLFIALLLAGFWQ